VASNIFLFSYESRESEGTDRCIQSRLKKLHDIKHLHGNLYLIKSDEDIHLLEKYLKDCFISKDRYYLLQVKDEPYRFHKARSKYIRVWMDDI
jgi:hypothetical protein